MTKVRETVRSSISSKHGNLLREEGFALSEIPNSKNYSNEPLTTLEKMGTGLSVGLLEKSSAIVVMELPGTLDDRVSRSELIVNLTLRGPFVYDPKGEYLCCLLVEGNLTSLVVISVKTSFSVKLNHKLPDKDATVTPFSYIDGKFIVFVGNGNIKFEEDTYYIYKLHERVFDIRRISEPPGEFIFETKVSLRRRLMEGTSVSLGFERDYFLQIDGIDNATFINDFTTTIAKLNPIAESNEVKILNNESTKKIEWRIVTDVGKILIDLTPGIALISGLENSEAIHEIDAVLQKNRRFVKI